MTNQTVNQKNIENFKKDTETVMQHLIDAGKRLDDISNEINTLCKYIEEIEQDQDEKIEEERTEL